MVFCFLVLLLLGSSAVALLSKEPGRVSGTGSSSSSPSADEIALLSAKSALSDPSGSLASWNASTRLCTWRGVMCSRRHPGRIVALSIDSMGLGGRVSPFLGNLSFLRTLDLGNNYLVGPIPPELGRLGRLRLLNLSVNSLEGGIPAALGMCTQLTMLSLAANQLQGEIPSVVGSLHNLALLDLQMNNLSGEIPPSVANLSSLQALALTFNTFSGAIPPYLGRLPELSELYLAEYGAGSIVSTHGDIYSYGILVLEMITGRRPTDNTFDGTSGIHKYVEMAINNSVMDIIDMDMALELETIGGLSSKTRQINSLISLLHLGLLCSAEMPSNRISTKEVIKELHVIKNALVQGEVSGR
nr:unnamed protein product [Digitaria exilis]